jgi:hypothetical protein
MLFAGNPISDKAKYRSVSQIVRTPVIITCNNGIFCKGPKWKERVFRYQWRKCDMLKTLQKNCIH